MHECYLEKTLALGRKMTQTITGTGLGTYGSSIGLEGGPKGNAVLGQGGESAYVNAASGNLILRQSDGFLADIGFGFDLFQTYNSRGERGGSWCFNVNSRVELTGTANKENSYVIRVSEDGHRSRFSWNAAKKSYCPDEGGTARLDFNQGNWTFREGSAKTASHYNTQGQLTRIDDRDSHLLDFHYTDGQLTSISDNGEKQKITWSFTNGLLQDVTTTNGEQVIHHLHYEYDEYQRIHKVSRDLGEGKTYWITYDYLEDSNQITDIKQSDGTTLHIDYDAEGRVKQLIDGEGRISTYSYEEGKTTLTNALKESWVYYYDAQNHLTGIDGPEQYRIRYHYDGTQLSTITQGNQVWKFHYNEAGDCVTLEAPNGQITLRQFDAEHRLIAETQYQDFDGAHHPTHPKTIRYVYDALGHLRFTIAADGTVTEQRYDANGQLTSSRCYLHTTYAVNDLSIDKSLSQDELTRWTSTQKKSEISLVEYKYDWRGQLAEEIHYSQVNTEGVGIAEHAQIARTRYDAAGRLVEKSVPTTNGWSVTTYIYDDLGRLTNTVNNQGHSQVIEYDDAQQRVIQTDANGLQTISIYDHSGLLLSTQRLYAKHSYGSTQYQYDAAGRLTVETGVDGLSTYFFYDAQGRMQAKVNGQGQLTQYHYTEDGLLQQTHQYAQRISTNDWLNEHPSLKDITPKSSNKDIITQTIYNQYNQIAYTIDTQGAVIGYTYDAEGHVLSKTMYATRLANYQSESLYSYSELNPFVDVTNDRHIAYYYDIQGRLSAEINGEGYAIEYHYNHLDLLTETHRYYNKATLPLSSNWSQDKPLSDIDDIHIYSLYNAQGLKTADIDGEGFIIEYRYTDNGQLQERISYMLRPNVFTINEYTNIDLIRPSQHANDHKTIYRYNDLGQLIEEKTQSGLITAYAYDEMGQLILKSLIDEHTHALRQQRTRYDVLGRVIQQLDELGCGKLNQANLNTEQIEAIWQQHSLHYTYDNSGLLLTKTDSLQRTSRYFYNEYRQLQFTLSADGAVVETHYNTLNQVESVRKYSAYLKEIDKFSTLKTQDIATRLKLLRNDKFDETITYEYNSIGQLIAKSTGSNGLTTSRYNAFGELELSTQAIDTNHHIDTSYAYDRRGLLSTKIEDVNNLARTTTNKYDAFGWTTGYIDGRRQEIRYQLNKCGKQITLINASKQFKTISYDAIGRVLIETDYSTKVVKEFTYDDNKLTLTNPSLNTQIITEYNAFGDKITLTDANNNLTEFHYDEHGLLFRVDSPENTFKVYHYDDAGQLQWQEDAGGHQIAYTYDAEGHLLTRTVDPNGLKINTSYQYDALGRQLQITESNGCIKQFTYDNQGRLTQSCVDPKGLNLITQLSYDARGLLLRQTELNPTGADKTIAYEWDNLGRRLSATIDPDGLKLATHYQYDQNDNLICQTDANHHSTHYVYDIENRCHYQIDSRGVVTEHVYNMYGEETQTIIYAKHISLLLDYTEASLKSALKKDSALDQYQIRVFDNGGKIIRTFNSLGYATEYTYDNNGNVISVIKYAVPVSLDDLKRGKTLPPSSNTGARHTYFAYDNLNQLRFQSNDHGYLTESRYDSSGQLQVRVNYAKPVSMADKKHYSLDYFKENLIPDSKHDKTTHYTYDQAGRLSIEISPQGAIKSYQYNGLNQMISCTRYASLANAKVLTNMDLSSLTKSTNDRTNYFVYDAAGREQYRISSEGQVVERRYDAVGNVLSQLTHKQHVSMNQYTAEDLQKTLLKHEAEARTNSYTYDATGRLEKETNAAKHSTTYTYDKNNNVKSKTDANNATWTYEYNEVNQLVKTISPQTNVTIGKVTTNRTIVTTTTYDSFGNVIQEVRDATGVKQTRNYEYDLMNQRIKTTYPGVKVNSATALASNSRQEIVKELSEEVRYNAFGEKIASSDKAGNWKHFAYNTQGLLTYSLDSRNGLTQYAYDTFGRLTCKTQFYNALKLTADCDYSDSTLSKAPSKSKYDRNEYSSYDLDDQLIEVSRDAVRTYNAKTKIYSTQSPTTQKTYNVFGEVIQTRVRINDTDWATTHIYFDHDGHQNATINAEGYLTTYTLTAFGDISSMTDYAQRAKPNGLYEYGSPEKHAKDRTVTFTYDELGQVTSKTLMQVPVSRIEKNKVITAPQDLLTTYEYDALGRLTLTKDAKDNIAYCYYDELGQLITKIGPTVQKGRAATTYSYDALGHLVETHQWANGANEKLQLNAASNKDIITHSEYDAEGLLLSETDGMQHTINYSYDANGNLARSFQILTKANTTKLIIDKRYRYDSENNLLQTATFKDNTTSSQKTEDAHYNIFGEVTEQGLNGKYTTHVEYDLIGRVWRSNTQGHYQIYVYDTTNNLTQIVSSTSSFYEEYDDKGADLSDKCYEEAESYENGKWQFMLQHQNNTYDAMGHLLTQEKAYNLRGERKNGNMPMASAKQKQTVDRWGNMLSYTNSLEKETLYEYDALNNLIKQKLPEVSFMNEEGVKAVINPVNSYGYDALGQLIIMTDANGQIASKDYDAAGHLISETDAKGVSRTKQYNLLGQLSSSQNERNKVTSYVYDKANRLLDIITPKTNQHYIYNEAGQLIKQEVHLDGNIKETTTMEYDALGHQIKREDAHKRVTQYTYDDAGRKTKEINADNKQQSWEYSDDGRLKKHTDLGNHVTSYEYNTNGLLIHETSTAKKDINYYYQGDGQLVQYADNGRGEVVNYTHDTEGQMLSKESSRTGSLKDSWIRETDYYQYDALGRLMQVRRRNPNDVDHRFPDDINKTLLTVDYDYDKVGNIRHTKVTARYDTKKFSTNDDYYLYDANNRMTLNKGQLVNGKITMTSAKGTVLSYDEAGNLSDANKYENGGLQEFHYTYTDDNQVEAIQKNNNKIQTKEYDNAGRVSIERRFDSNKKLSQTNTMNYIEGELKTQTTTDISDSRITSVATSSYLYDNNGNIQSWTVTVNKGSANANGSAISHAYTYELWDTYQQKTDSVTFSAYNSNTTKGLSTRSYDSNGLLTDSKDDSVDGTNQSNNIQYRNSSVDGIRGRIDKTGQTSYLTVAGKTIGELHLDNNGTQSLNVYGGFTPVGSQQEGHVTLPQIKAMAQSKNKLLYSRAAGDIADGTLPESPQDSLGTYTLQPGDTLESVAQQVYGDSSLWYLIADANGISDRKASVGGDKSPIRAGQRLTLPPVATGQHHTNATHKVLSSTHMLGNTAATAALPTPRPPKPKHHSIWSKVIVAVVATVATVLTAGALGVLAGATASSLGTLISTGLSVLGGGLAGGTAIGLGTTMAIGFSAGFVGSLASQGAANALGMQKGLDFTSALISGLGTAATAGLGHELRNVKALKDVSALLKEKSYANFNIASAVEMMEQNAASQAINTSLRKHQHFDWTELGVSGVAGGILGGEMGRDLNERLGKIDHNSGILRTELQSLIGAGAQTATTGAHFDALQVLGDNLGNAIGNAVVNLGTSKTPTEKIAELFIDKEQENTLIENMSDGTYLTNKINESEHNSISLSKKSHPIPTPETTSSDSKDNDFFLYGGELSRFIGDTIYNDSEWLDGRGMIKSDIIIPFRPKDNITYQQSPYSFDEALDKQLSLKKHADKAKYWVGKPGQSFDIASRFQVGESMDVDKIFSNPKGKIQFMDLHYQEGIKASDLNILLKGKGVLNNMGAAFLKAAKENNINPIYLMNHALHESDNGKSLLAENNNFFGVGALDGNANETGIKFARQHGWTTPEKGILGATKIIAKKWINKSQNTLYSMRWNPLNPAQMEYATDINWAQAQAERIYKQLDIIHKLNHSSYKPQFIVPKYR